MPDEVASVRGGSTKKGHSMAHSVMLGARSSAYASRLVTASALVRCAVHTFSERLAGRLSTTIVKKGIPVYPNLPTWVTLQNRA